jgi:formylglycine-generating enzyme required for sulfatase activity
VDWYQRNRARSRQLFDLLDPSVYYSRPIALRNPIVFYEGHLPAFSVIAFLRRGLGAPPVNERLEELFARGIDPDSEAAAVPRSGASTVWPSRQEVLEFGREVDEAVIHAMRHASVDQARPGMRRAEGLFTALEHEAMHQETMLYMWHRLPHEHKKKPADVRYELGGAPPSHRTAIVPGGMATLGADRQRTLFGWDNEFDELCVESAPFEIDVYPVTNADFLEFIDAGGYSNRDLWSDEGWEWRTAGGIEHPSFQVPATGSARSGRAPSTRVARSGQAPSTRVARSGQVDGWLWRGMFEFIPLPLAWPVYVSQAEASAYARWKGRRLPTEAEYHRAAFGTPEGKERQLPWDGDVVRSDYGNFDFASWEPVPVGARPAGVSAWGVHDLVGNGWEWTSTEFGPFPGFQPMVSYPEYSAEFFDGHHYVMKGASPGTARELIRRSFRNWFRANYPYVYAKFRTALTKP